MSVNSLIAQGGTGRSPVQSFIRGQAQGQNLKQNNLAMQSTQQRMGINAENQDVAKQQRQIKGIASLAKYLDSLPDDMQREEAFKKAVVKMPDMGLEPPPFGSTYASMKPQLEMVKTQVFGEQEKWETKQTEQGVNYQVSNAGKEIKSPRNVTDSLKGTSEFERLLYADYTAGRMTKQEYLKERKKRRGVLAGTDMRITDSTRIAEQKRKSGVKETSDLRNEYQGGVEHFGNMSKTIDEATIALDSGNTGLADTMLNQVMSQVQDDNVRAYAMYQQFDKPFGNVANRVGESITRFLTGKRSDEEKAEIKQTLNYFKEAYAQPKRKAMRDRYRAMAVQGGHDPFSVVPPIDPADVRDSTLIDRKRKKELMKLHFPELFKK